MKVIIISDNPESPLFHQIIKLKKDIETLISNPVDLISFSNKKIYLDINQKADISNKINIVKKLGKIFQKIKYDFYIFSLHRDILSMLFQNKINILEYIEPNSEIFIFGASSELRSLHGTNIHIFRRPGVSKLTKKFKEKVLAKIDDKLKLIDSNKNTIIQKGGSKK